MKAKPFLKWAGGKRNLIPELEKYVPTTIFDYYEPFLGGGALFFHLSDRINNAYLSDINTKLIITYNTIKYNPEKVIELLTTDKLYMNEYLKMNDDEFAQKIYNTRRLIFNKFMVTHPEIASSLIFLNHTCFNGLYRVNKQGYFNVPYGHYKNPLIFNKDNLLACSEALDKAIIQDLDYVEFFKECVPTSEDLVYLDPPYYPIKSTSFHKYSEDTFLEKEHIKLEQLAWDLRSTGATIIISNSDTEFIRDLYHRWNVNTVYAPRNISAKPIFRKSITELIITN